MESKFLWRLLFLIAFIWLGKHAISKIFSSDTIEFKPISKQELDESQMDIHAGGWQLQKPIKAEAHAAPFFKIVAIKKESEKTKVADGTPAPNGAIKAEAGKAAKIAGTTDPKKDEKKKKKKKKEPPKTAKVNAINPPLPGDSKPATTSAPVDPVASSQVAANPPPAEKTKPKTVNDWVNLLFNPLTFESLSKMTAYLQAGAMDPTTYYSLIDKIINEYGLTGKEYAELALANVPSYDSFIRLAALTSSDNPQLAAKSQEALGPYAKPRNIPMLSKALESTDPYVRYQTLLVIRETANTLISSNSINSARPLRTYASLNYTSLFGPLVPLLQTMRSSEKESRLIQEINRTLASVGDLLNRASAQQVPATGH